MKKEDIKQLSIAELSEKINEQKGSHAKLKLNHAVSPIENPASITDSRKTIARLQTELRARQLAENKK